MIAKAVKKNWTELKKYRYLLLASAVITLAIFALLVMQYRSVKRTQEHARKTMKANLELHLFEISEEAKRKILDHANHIMHGVRQQRVRERNIQSIERAFTRLAKRYPEIEDFYVVFFARGQENETWKALKFARPDPLDPNPQTYEGIPVGKLIEDLETSESLRRAWQSISKESQTTLYTAYDPATAETAPRQYFFHTVYELDRLRRNTPLENIGLLVFSANAEQFPSKDYLSKLVAKHQERDREIDGLVGKMDYTVTLQRSGAGTRDLVATNTEIPASLVRRFDDSDKLFPNLTFGISSPDLEAKSYANEYVRSSIFLGLGAALVAVIGLVLSWRATRREMRVAQLKSDFLASISHELKTPLTAIRAFGDLLHTGRATKPERIREYGGMIKTESDRLTALINNILEMSRLEKGVRKYRMEEGDLRQTVVETVEVFRHSPEISKFDIQIRLALDAVETKFDEGAIRQALINLLSNAVKYSLERADSRIEITLQKSENEVILAVRDFGIGVSKEEQRDIFLPFQRSRGAEIQAKGGTGLGLAIVREIARGHGGDVSVESEPGSGAVFRLHLPILTENAKKDYEENGAYFGHRRRA